MKESNILSSLLFPLQLGTAMGLDLPHSSQGYYTDISWFRSSPLLAAAYSCRCSELSCAAHLRTGTCTRTAIPIKMGGGAKGCAHSKFFSQDAVHWFILWFLFGFFKGLLSEHFLLERRKHIEEFFFFTNLVMDLKFLLDNLFYSNFFCVCVCVFLCYIHKVLVPTAT